MYCNDVLHEVLAFVQLRQVMREGLVRRISVRQMLENKFEAVLRYVNSSNLIRRLHG